MKNPLSKLAYCSNPDMHPKSNFLLNRATPDGSMARVRFELKNAKFPFYNPNILPYPAGSEYPYFGLVRTKSKSKSMYHHELAYCDLKWAETAVIGHTVLECAEPGMQLDFGEEWTSPDGSCVKHSFLALAQGQTDPRLFFSALGEPLMIFGTNGHHNCLGQFIVDLRVLVPGFDKKMHLSKVPIRYPRLTEIPRVDLEELEKNWFLMYDPLDSNKEYVHYDYLNRDFSPLINDSSLTTSRSSSRSIVDNLLVDYSESTKSANDIHQATNSLLVTLCDFPCIPTIHNTVLIEIVHLKLMHSLTLYYRRYVVVMNATAPFEILGRTENLMYAGTSLTEMVYTVSMVWDKDNFAGHEPWNEKIHGGQEIWFALKTNRAATNSMSADSLMDSSNLYHGWLNDMVLINFGIKDSDSGCIHVRARELLDCIRLAD
ncbi:uncharacterized protein V1516DRAFT_628205 [Lipomyces oligophaga]|uniref:uncharacterized protein n=1 Tax=Lipomyces oligophaga TaxID=45792 RepID=UPI0034CDCD40